MWNKITLLTLFLNVIPWLRRSYDALFYALAKKYFGIQKYKLW